MRGGGSDVALANECFERRILKLSMRGDGRNSRSLQQERKEKNKPNQHGLPPTIAYGARIIGVKHTSRNIARLVRRSLREGVGAVTNVDDRFDDATPSGDIARDQIGGVGGPAPKRATQRSVKRNGKGQVWRPRNNRKYCKTLTPQSR